MPLHLDGARLWESQPFYDRPLAEIAGLFDSVYVSFYKGLGAQAGAVRRRRPRTWSTSCGSWRKRMGGTLFAMTPYAVGGLLGLRDELPRMGEYADWARSLAAALPSRGLRVHPAVPGMCTFEVYADGVAEEVNERLLDLHGGRAHPAVRAVPPDRRPGHRSSPSWPATPPPPTHDPEDGGRLAGPGRGLNGLSVPGPK